MKLTGAEVMVKCLQAEGVSTIFGYPGGAILHFYDALRDETSIRHIRSKLSSSVCRVQLPVDTSNRNRQ